MSKVKIVSTSLKLLILCAESFYVCSSFLIPSGLNILEKLLLRKVGNYPPISFYNICLLRLRAQKFLEIAQGGEVNVLKLVHEVVLVPVRLQTTENSVW